MVELVKSEPGQQVSQGAEVYPGVEEGEGEGVMAQYDDTYSGEYEEQQYTDQYSDQYGVMDHDSSQQG